MYGEDIVERVQGDLIDFDFARNVKLDRNGYLLPMSAAEKRQLTLKFWSSSQKRISQVDFRELYDLKILCLGTRNRLQFERLIF